MTKSLTKSESTELAECEAVIDKGINSFFDVGNALFTIRDKKLYRADHDDFRAYCDNKWGFTPQQNGYLIGSEYNAQKEDKSDNLKKGVHNSGNGKNTEKSPKGHNDPSGNRLSEEVSQATGVSEKTVRRNAEYATALDIIGSVNSKAKNDILSGSLKIDKKDVIDIGKLHESEIGGCILNVKQGRKWNNDGKSNAGKSLGKCPNCAGTKWTKDESGSICSKCHHPHGEPTGDVDGDRIKTQRQKTAKTVEAAMRAFDDLHLLSSNPHEHAESIATCKILLKTAKEWK